MKQKVSGPHPYLPRTHHSSTGHAYPQPPPANTFNGLCLRAFSQPGQGANKTCWGVNAQEQSSANNRGKLKIYSSVLLIPQMGQLLGMFYMVP